MLSETIEHTPPRIFFLDKRRPSSHEFPACARCNHGTSAGDQIAALCAYIMGSAIHPELPHNHFLKLMKGVRNNQPEVIDVLAKDGDETFEYVNGRFLPVVRMKVARSLFDDWLHPWAAKLGFALWYEHFGSIMPPDGRIGVRWVTNEAIIDDNVPNKLLEQLENVGEVKQGEWKTNDQFFYRFGLNEAERFACFVPILFQSSYVLIYAFENGSHLARFPKLARFKTSKETGIISENT